MGKVMKFERQANRQARKMGPTEAPPMPGMPAPTGGLPESSPMPPPAAAPAPPAENPVMPSVAPSIRSKSAQKSPLDLIPGYVQAFDWGRTKVMAKKASASGVPDEQIDAAIDNALPPPKIAAGLPLHELVAVASAATDQKRQEYFPLLQPHLEHARNLPPDEQGELADHLKLIGMFGRPQETA